MLYSSLQPFSAKASNCTETKTRHRICISYWNSVPISPQKHSQRSSTYYIQLMPTKLSDLARDQGSEIENGQIRRWWEFRRINLQKSGRPTRDTTSTFCSYCTIEVSPCPAGYLIFETVVWSSSERWTLQLYDTMMIGLQLLSPNHITAVLNRKQAN